MGALIKPYRARIALIVGFTIAANALNLLVPRLIARTIDQLGAPQFVLRTLTLEWVLVGVSIFLLTYGQNVAQVLASERVASDLRAKVVDKLSTQSLAYIEKVTTATLLTNLTSDIDSVKVFVSQAVGAITSSVFVILGASMLLISINWKLGLGVIAVLPIIATAFRVVFGRVRKHFLAGQQAVDRLNKAINESILGAALIRLLNAHQPEYDKFLTANRESMSIGLSIVRLFASLIPIIIFSTNIATLMILVFGGRFVINGTMSIGNFAAFNSYLAILVFPVIVIGFMSTVMAQSGASYMRVSAVLNAPLPPSAGTVAADLRGDAAAQHVTVQFGEKMALKAVSLEAHAGSRTAVIGPTAAGKTQLLYLLSGLMAPTSGTVLFDGRPIEDYEPASLRRQVAFVFQDATLFNMTLRENIAFSDRVDEADLQKAIRAADLNEFINALPEGLETMVSERGTSLSGGQKQRIMLARALALNPRVLLLDDFTARVDLATERRILENVRREYPGLTLISVTQKIAPVEDYDQIVLLMEGEVLATGTHRELLESSPEYAQIYESQRSTRHYESLHAE